MANIDRIVRVQIALHTASIRSQNFNELMLLGEFSPQDEERVIIITSADQLLNDYGVRTSDALYRAALVAFSQIPSLPHIFIGNTAPLDRTEYEALRDQDPTIGANDIMAAMAAIANENNDFYAICDTSRDSAIAEELAMWAEGHEKLFVTCLTTPDTLLPWQTDQTSLASRLMAGNYFRTAWWYNPDPFQFPDVAATVRAFTKYPGAETWANQRLASVANTRLGETNARNVFGKNGNTFEPFRNISITQNGKVAGGEWIDIIRFRDWLTEEIRLRVFQQMIDTRIPYTGPGIAIVRSRVVQALDMGVSRGGIAPEEVDPDTGLILPSYTVTVPGIASVSANNRAGRILQDVHFTARLAGAIHVVEIQGILTYEMAGAQVIA